MLHSKRKLFKRIIKFCIIYFSAVLCGIIVTTIFKAFNYQKYAETITNITTETTEVLTENTTEYISELATLLIPET